MVAGVKGSAHWPASITERARIVRRRHPIRASISFKLNDTGTFGGVCRVPVLVVDLDSDGMLGRHLWVLVA